VHRHVVDLNVARRDAEDLRDFRVESFEIDRTGAASSVVDLDGENLRPVLSPMKRTLPGPKAICPSDCTAGLPTTMPDESGRIDATLAPTAAAMTSPTLMRLPLM
jgi:hypothetical protein